LKQTYSRIDGNRPENETPATKGLTLRTKRVHTAIQALLINTRRVVRGAETVFPYAARLPGNGEQGNGLFEYYKKKRKAIKTSWASIRGKSSPTAPPS